MKVPPWFLIKTLGASGNRRVGGPSDITDWSAVRVLRLASHLGSRLYTHTHMHTHGEKAREREWTSPRCLVAFVRQDSQYECLSNWYSMHQQCFHSWICLPDCIFSLFPPQSSPPECSLPLLVCPDSSNILMPSLPRILGVDEPACAQTEDRQIENVSCVYLFLSLDTVLLTIPPPRDEYLVIAGVSTRLWIASDSLLLKVKTIQWRELKLLLLGPPSWRCYLLLVLSYWSAYFLWRMKQESL